VLFTVHETRLGDSAQRSLLLASVANDSLSFKTTATSGLQAQRSVAGGVVRTVDPLVEGEVV
jgi:hypothetical protein